MFPAFTGMTAGVGLSGDLANPRRSIPLGTLAATLTGMVVYVAVVIKLAASATPETLAGDQLIMARDRAVGSDHPDRARLRHAVVGDRLDPGGARARCRRWPATA